MVIHQFNKLIRNKWVWGVFAVLVSAAFCFDDLFTTREREERSAGDAGLLAGEKVDAKLYSALVEEARGLGRQSDWRLKSAEVNRQAWENYAALVIAGKDGLEPSETELQNAIRNDPTFQTNGAFSFALYQARLREIGMSPERFEEYLRHRLSVAHIAQAVLGSAAWTSPMELDRAISDMTDTFTVKVARFKQDKKDADAVKIDEAGVKKWYDENVKSLELPERIKIRYVRFDATKKDILDKMVVTDDEMKDRYDVTVDKYTSTDTNGVETVKKFEEVKDGIEKELRQIAAVQFYETNLNWRAYSKRAAEGSSRLDEIAKEEGLKVETSDWFSLDGKYQEGFMKRISSILPGAQSAAESIAELDSSSEDLRYAVVSSERAVWLVEKADVNAAHTPDFAEAKDAITQRALRAAKADVFKAAVEKIVAGGSAAVLASKDVSTNLVFAVADLKQNEFQDQVAIIRAAMKLNKGEVSDVVVTGTGRALVVVCEDRVPGDAAKAVVLKSQIRDEVSSIIQRQLPVEWLKWNLERMGFEPGEISSVDVAEEDESAAE